MPQALRDFNVPSNLQGICCDIDDTLTEHGKLVPGVLQWMHDAQQRGLRVIPITGRPAGWVDHIARAWPVDGVVGENGGLWFWADAAGMHRRFAQDQATRLSNQRALSALASSILEAVPGTALASDQPYRELDLAIDFCEDVPALGREAIDAIVREFEQAGATCKVSSIHVNGWFGSFDKLSGIARFHEDAFGSALDPSRWVFFGDSANDEPLFSAFPHSIGVANVRAFLDRMVAHPTFITDGRGGHGFNEGMAHVLGCLG